MNPVVENKKPWWAPRFFRFRRSTTANSICFRWVQYSTFGYLCTHFQENDLVSCTNSQLERSITSPPCRLSAFDMSKSQQLRPKSPIQWAAGAVSASHDPAELRLTHPNLKNAYHSDLHRRRAPQRRPWHSCLSTPDTAQMRERVIAASIKGNRREVMRLPSVTFG